jgi:hypothetical protein
MRVPESALHGPERVQRRKEQRFFAYLTNSERELKVTEASYYLLVVFQLIRISGLVATS